MNYAEELKKYNLKVTPQRVAIVQELYLFGHLNIDQLYTKLLNQFPSISLATIYKNMNAMIERIFIQEVKIPHEKSVYELSKASHAHVVCEKCKKIEDIMISTQGVLEEVKEKSSFSITNSAMVFSGICSECSK
ncbi:MAG: Fur family transcriptional regulator [Candidatus Marinarcus sp.]|uniref:Fur family transcriptional regulator n=1 Tax=Candidatus Marinarcus sp. TaxID=3100987 RepID=UPI003AFF9001